jgi:hypothetical protein
MGLAEIITECQDFLLDTGSQAMLEARVAQMVSILARVCPVFGNVQVLYNRWAVGRYVEATQSYIDLTAEAQGSGTVPLTTTTVGDGLMIGAVATFDMVSFLFAAIPAGSATWEWTYWNGWQWTALTLKQAPNLTAGGLATVTFEPPDDWVSATPQDIVWPESVVQEYFWIRIVTLTVPSIIPVALDLDVRLRFFPLPENVLQLLSVHFFPRELEPVGISWGMDALDPSWRTRTGTPTRYTQDIETTRRLRLLPSPIVQGAQGLPPFLGIPGAMDPTNHVIVFFLEAPPVEHLSDWFEGLVAYLLVAWQAAREGELQDVAMSQAMFQLVGMLVSLLQGLYHFPGEELVETAFVMPLWESLV